MLHLGLECKCENITSEGQGDVTCDSLGDVTWSHGIHDVRDLSGRSEGSRRRKPHQKGQKPRLHPVISARGFLLPWFRINGEQSADCSLVNSTLMSEHGVCEGGGPLVLARRGAPVSTSTAVLWADLFCQAGWVTLLHGSEGHVSSRRSIRSKRAGEDQRLMRRPHGCGQRAEAPASRRRGTPGGWMLTLKEQEKTSVLCTDRTDAGRELEHVSSRRSARSRRPGEDQRLMRQPHGSG